MFHATKNVFDNLNFLQQNKIPQKKQKNLFQDSLALRIACAIEGSLDHCCVSRLSWASQVYVHLLVIDRGPGTFVASAHHSPFFSSLHLSSLFFQCLHLTLFVLFSFFFFSDFFASLVLQNQNVHGRKFHLFLCSSLCFYSHFPLVFLVKENLMAEDKTRHQNKWVKAVVRMVTRVWKKSLFLACFLSMIEGLSWWS